MVIEESRIQIPYFNDIWNIFYKYIKAYIQKTTPVIFHNFDRRAFVIHNIPAPQNAFFSYIRVTADLYFTQTDNQYAKIHPNFNECSINPNMRLDKKGKIGIIEMSLRIGTSFSNMLNDIMSEFYHEMTHAYEEYLRLTGNNGRNNTQTNNTQTNTRTYNPNVLNNIVRDPKHFTPLERNLAILFYYFDPEEYKARLNNFYGEIFRIKKQNLNYNLIDNSRTWRRVLGFETVVQDISQIQDSDQQDRLVLIANVMNNHIKQGKYRDFLSLVNDIQKKYKKLKNNTYKDFKTIIDNKRR